MAHVSTAVDVSGWLRRNAHWLRVESSIMIMLITTLAVVIPLRPTAAERFRAQLNARVSTILEQISPTEHSLHGHVVVGGNKIICTAETFGTEPAGARNVAEVRWVYAYYLCASAAPGTDWDFASRISGPTAVSLAQPPEVRIAAAGLGYPERVREIIPDDLEARAFGGFVDHGLPNTLRQRYEHEIAEAAPASS